MRLPIFRVHIFAILGALIGAFILVIATLSVNGTTLQSFQTLDQQARAQDKGVASTSAQPCANPRLQVNAPIRVLHGLADRSHQHPGHQPGHRRV